MRKSIAFLLALIVMQDGHSQPDFSSPTASLQEKLSEKSIGKKRENSRIISFDLNGGLIFFEARLNGVKDTFILDTGSPGLLLNEDTNPSDSSSFSAVGVSGKVTFQKKKGQLFQMGNMHKRGLESLCADLSHLERVKKQRFRGMVGHKVFEENELLIDYLNKTIQLLDNEKEDIVGGLCRKGKIPFVKQQHFAVVSVKIGGRKYNFGIDTGAEVNLLDQEIAKWLSDKHLQKTRTIKIRGVNKRKVQASEVNISKMRVNRKDYHDMPFVIMDMQNLNAGFGIELDGLLGYPFLSSSIFSIDYKNQFLQIWEQVKENIMVQKR